MSGIGKFREPDWAERAAGYIAVLKAQGPNKDLPGMSFEVRAVMIAFSQELDKQNATIRQLSEQVRQLTKRSSHQDPE